jgi:hypothetical protein
VGEFLFSENFITLDAGDPRAFALVREVNIKEESLSLGGRRCDLLFKHHVDVFLRDRFTGH